LKAWETETASMEKFTEMLETGRDIRNCLDELSTKDIEFLNEYRLLTAKPTMFVVNLSLRDYQRKKNKFLKLIKLIFFFFLKKKKKKKGITLILFPFSFL